jgi:mono/diheme cytochrome c family protein
MKSKSTKIALILLAIAWFASRDASARQNTDEFFEKKVRPILAQKCQVCHNAKAGMAGLDLSTAEGFAKGGDSGPVIDTEKVENSRILKVISYDEKLKMPPTGKLKDEEIAAISEWVKAGAPWPGSKTGSKDVPKRLETAAAPINFTDDEKKFWAFQAVSAAQPPPVKNEAWIRSPIDRFVLARLESKGLTPAPPATKVALLRRATFDLTGLPPTSVEITAFLADTTPNAFTKVVERLLASPRYGEKWGRHWLDVARYADSSGNDEDHRYPHAWRYRDYVIDSFNKDLPFDQFIQEQIAGDLLPSTGVNRRGIVATGFLALGPKALAQQDKTKMLYDVYDEQVDVTTKAFLGLTVSCARCHDHKFDPIRTRDYYSMISVFASTRSFSKPEAFVSEPLTTPLVPKTDFDRYEAARRANDDLMKRNQNDIDEIISRVKEPAARSAASQLAAIMLASRRVYASNADPAEEARKLGLKLDRFQRWVNYLKPGKPREHLLAWENASPADLERVAIEYQSRFSARLAEWNKRVAEWRKKYDEAIARKKSPLPGKPEFEAGHDRFFAQVYFGKEGPLQFSEKDEGDFSASDVSTIKQLRAQRDEIRKRAPKQPEMACAVTEGEAVSQKVFIRGDYHNPGDDVPRAVPAILTIAAPQPPMRNGSGRLELARWIASPSNPLTSRVIVNRMWHWHFGEGIVGTPDNFGRMGETPADPGLLDYLAQEFFRGGWSLKAMHRAMMLSSTYQMSSLIPKEAVNRDPENRYLSRFNRRRLDVEEMRDALLAIDGSLDTTMGGSLQTGTGTDGENDNKRLSLKPESSKRRSVYLPLRRANLPALLNLFDFGDATTVNGERQLTNVPTQALFWLNSEFVTERAANVARGLVKSANPASRATINRAYLRVLNRPASVDEIARAQSYLREHRRRFPGKDSDLNGWASLVRVLMASNEFMYVD